MNCMEEKIILLVEDNPDDELLIMRALKKNGVKNEVIVARDGVEALDYLFGVGVYAGRDKTVMPRLILLDLRLPKIDGLEAPPIGGYAKTSGQSCCRSWSSPPQKTTRI